MVSYFSSQGQENNSLKMGFYKKEWFNVQPIWYVNLFHKNDNLGQKIGWSAVNRQNIAGEY